MTSKLSDVSKLDLPPVWQKRIEQIIYDNRMLYEPWLESAGSFNEIRARLKARGYTNLPIGTKPLLNFDSYSKTPLADTSSCKIRQTMLRKKK